MQPVSLVKDWKVARGSLHFLAHHVWLAAYCDTMTLPVCPTNLHWPQFWTSQCIGWRWSYLPAWIIVLLNCISKQPLNCLHLVLGN